MTTGIGRPSGQCGQQEEVACTTEQMTRIIQVSDNKQPDNALTCLCTNLFKTKYIDILFYFSRITILNFKL